MAEEHGSHQDDKNQHDVPLVTESETVIKSQAKIYNYLISINTISNRMCTDKSPV